MFRVDREELAGKRALVTGGTQGVGAAIVSRLIATGAKVATSAGLQRLPVGLPRSPMRSGGASST
jgi:NAD(P)-dependent dehydrogenase (short-subunit alcohol dehydrogenase family)